MVLHPRAEWLLSKRDNASVEIHSPDKKKHQVSEDYNNVKKAKPSILRLSSPSDARITLN